MIPAGGRSHWRQVTLQHIPKRSTQQRKNIRESYQGQTVPSWKCTFILPIFRGCVSFREGSFLKKAHSKHSPDSNIGKRWQEFANSLIDSPRYFWSTKVCFLNLGAKKPRKVSLIRHSALKPCWISKKICWVAGGFIVFVPPYVFTRPFLEKIAAHFSPLC